jgi:hypothetical protein
MRKCLNTLISNYIIEQTCLETYDNPELYGYLRDKEAKVNYLTSIEGWCLKEVVN